MASANTTSTTIVFNSDDRGNGLREGYCTFSDTALTATDYVEISCGFKPRYVEWTNVTDRLSGEHFQGMADNSCVKRGADNAGTLEITSGNGGITLTPTGFRVLQDATLALCALSTVAHFIAYA